MKFVLYKDAKKDPKAEYRWRLVATNGKIIADSGEGYSNKSDCQAGFDLVKKNAATASVEDTTAAGSLGR